MIPSKKEILNKIRQIKILPVEELGSEVKIRALSEGEFTAIEMSYVMELISIGIGYDELQDIRQGKMETFDPIKMSSLSLASLKRQWIICSKSLSVDEEWGVEDIQQLPVDVIDKISIGVEKISRNKST